MARVLVWGETREGKLTGASLEAFGAAAQLGEVHGAVFTDANLSATGAKSVLTAKELTYIGERFAALLAKAIAAVKPTYLLLPASVDGKDLAARISAKLDAALASDCIALELAGGDLQIKRPIYAGKLIAKIKLSGELQIATLRAHAFSLPEASGSPETDVLDAGDLTAAEEVDLQLEKGKQVNLQDAGVVVSGGRGMGGADDFSLIEQLADALGAAVGASRAVVDAGWRPHAEQVGQTGKIVSPNLYIACGISGAIQHRVGMQSSKVIVAVNTDPEAPIFKIADYGIVGDVHEVLPAFTNAIKELKG